MSPPTSRPPAGVPTSGGNTKYAIVAVVLLLAIGGIFAMRVFSTPPKPLPPLPSASVGSAAEPPSNPKLDDIPPPPPPPEEAPEAGPVTQRVAVAPNAGCQSKCDERYGTPELTQALSVRAQQARRCYNTALAQDSTLKGHVNLAVRVGPTGNVCSVSVAGNDMGTPAVANCAANILRNSVYPAPKGGCVEANIPLNFVAQGQ